MGVGVGRVHFQEGRLVFEFCLKEFDDIFINVLGLSL